MRFATPVALIGAGLLAACGGGGSEAGTSLFGSGAAPPFSAASAPDATTCAAFTFREDAQAYFDSHDAPLLDPDNDGLACEDLPTR